MYQKKNFKNTILQNSEKILANKKLFFSTWFLVMFLHVAYFFYALNDYTIKSNVFIQDKNDETQMINYMFSDMNFHKDKFNILSNKDWHDSIYETYKNHIFSNKNIKIIKIVFNRENNQSIIYFKAYNKKNIKSTINDIMFELEFEAEKVFHKKAAEKIYKNLSAQRELLIIQRAWSPQGNKLKLINDKINILDKIINLQFLTKVIETSSFATNKIYKKEYEFEFRHEIKKYHFFLQSLLLSFLITIVLLMIYNNRKKLFSI
jgi:hypothetical protein